MVNPNDERCPDCGALLILVGRRHLCLPPEVKERMAVRPRRGRPPIGKQAMTVVERKQRSRLKGK